MNNPCSHCHTVHWLDERLSDSSKTKTQFGTCCLSGKAMLPPKQQPPDALKSLFDGTGPRAREFRENIRQYNATLVFTSLGVDIVGADVASYKVYIIIKLESFSAITTSAHSLHPCTAMPSNGSAVISGITFFENPRAPDPVKSKTLFFDARFYAEGEDEETMFAALCYFNRPPLPGSPYTFPPSCICYIEATVSIKANVVWCHLTPIFDIRLVPSRIFNPPVSPRTNLSWQGRL